MAAKNGPRWGTSAEQDAAFKDDAPETNPVETKVEAPASSGGPQKPTEGGAAAKAADTTPSQPSADSTTPGGEQKPAEPTAAQKRKWKIPLKVAGADEFEEIDEDDLDETKETEGRKRLIANLQKARDYDRPGGALDKAAQKKAEAAYAKRMVDEGLWVVVGEGKDAKLEWSPHVSEFRKWKETQKAQAAGVAPQQGAAAPTQTGVEQTPRQKEIASFAAKFAKDGLSPEEMAKWQELVADERIDLRDREKEQRAAEASRKKQDEDARAKQDEDNVRAGRERISGFVKSLEDNFKDPLTGKVKTNYVEFAKREMERVAVETQDWAQAEAHARAFAKQHADEMAAYAAALKAPKAPTAPAPAPVLRGGQTASAGDNGHGSNGKNGKFDPRKSFGQQGASFDEWVRSEAGRE